MAGTPLATAFVRLRADGADLGKDIGEQVGKAAPAAEAGGRKVGRKVVSGAEPEVAGLSKVVDARVAKAGADAASSAQGAGKRIGKGLGDGVGEQTKLIPKRVSDPVTRAGKDAAGPAKKTGTTIGKKIGEGISGQKDEIKKSITGAFALLGAAELIKGSIREATDLNETVSKTTTVFGEASDSVLEFGKTASKSVGQSNQQALEAAATFGNLFIGLKIGRGDAAKMSIELDKLASDFASFHNADPTEVIEGLTAAFRGEFDTVQRFVPTLSAATVQQEAMRESGVKSAAALTDQQKALATYHLLVSGAGAAQGDFARTSAGAANSQRSLTAEFKDLQATVGGELLPVFTDGLHVLNGFASGLAAVPPPARTAAFEIAALVGASALLRKGTDSVGGKLIDYADKTGQAGEVTSRTTKGVRGLGTAMRTLGEDLPAATAAAGALGFGLEALKDKLGDVGAGFLGLGKKSPDFTPPTKGARDLSDTFGVLIGQAQQFEPGLLSDKLVRVAAHLEDIRPTLTQIGKQLGSDVPSAASAADLALSGLDKSLAELSGSNPKAAALDMKLITEVLVGQGVSVDTIKKKFPAYSDALKTASANALINARAITASGDAAKDAAVRLDHYRTVLLGIAGTHLSSVEAEIQFQDGLRNIKETLKDVEPAQRKYAQALDVTTEAGGRQAQSVIDQIKNIVARADAVRDAANADGHQATAQQLADDKLREGLATLRENAAKLGLNTDAVNDLIGAYGKLPEQKKTEVSAPGAKSAEDLMNAVTKAANGIPLARSTHVAAPGAVSAASLMDAATKAANGIPQTRRTTIQVDDAGARKKIRDFDRLLTTLDGRKVRTYLYNFESNILTPAGGGKSAGEHKATGGPVFMGARYKVGEHGPEDFVAPADGWIVNAAQRQQMSGGGASPAAMAAAVEAGAYSGTLRAINEGVLRLDRRGPEVMARIVNHGNQSLAGLR